MTADDVGRRCSWKCPALPLPPDGGARGTVELVAASGARLILRVPDVGPAKLLPVVELFLRHRAFASPALGQGV